MAVLLPHIIVGIFALCVPLSIHRINEGHVSFLFLSRSPFLICVVLIRNFTGRGENSFDLVSFISS